MKSVLKQALSVILVILIAAIKVNAQETTAEIQGLITVGKTGVAGASITAVHQPTGTKYVTTSRTDGRYNLTNLKIGGPYTLEVSYVGLKTEKQDDINLLLGQTFKANFNLQEASSSLKDVVVTSNKQDKVFNNARTGSQETFNRNQITSLPTISRSYKDIIKLTPTYNSGSFGGQSSQLNNITIDGANFNNSFGLSGDIGGQTGQNAISLDAIEQIQVNTSPFDVKNGGFVGGGINSVSRSGTNTYSGSVYEYFKNKNWQGYEVNGAPYTIKVPKQDYSYDLKGFTASGAIIKNKLFIFVNGEQESNTTPGTTWTASTAANPANGTSISNANKDSLDKLASFLKSKFNYDPGAYQGYSFKSASKRLTIKLDWNINANNTFTFKYNYLKSSDQKPASNSGSVNSQYGRASGNYGMPFFGAGYEINNNANVFIAELNTKFSNRMSNKLQVGYTALRDFRNALTSNVNFPMVDILDGNSQPFTSFGHELYTYGNKLNTDIYQFNDNLTFYAGKHEITLGTQTSFKKYLNGFSPDYQGVYRFASLNDFINSANGLGTKSTQYRLSYTLGDGPFPLVGPKDFEAGVYVQDKYRATDKLTFTYGVRFDYTKFYNTFLYNPVVDTLRQFYNGTRANTGAAPNMAVQISPRIGFNYDVNGDQTLQIRGGAGLFQGAPPFVWISNQASNSGMALFGSFTNNAPNGNVFSPDVNAYRPAATASLSKSYSINVTDPNYKFPQVLKSTLAADKKLGKGWTLTAEGTFTKQLNASVFQNIALPSTGLIRLSDGRWRFPKISSYPQAGIANSASNPNIQNAIYMTNSDAGYAWTGTLQIQKITKNFILTAAYTRQEAKDAAVSGSTAATMWGSKATSANPNEFEIGYSNNYIPHRLIASVVYKKEFIKDQTTSIGLVYEGAPNYATSYLVATASTANESLNGDGNSSNDLMFIPKDPSQIKLVNASPVSGVADTRNQTELWNQLDNFIRNNPYLNSRRGQFAERNGYVLPWTHKLDLNFTQDVKVTVGKNKHTFRFTADIYNFTNLLNKDWGVFYIPTTTTPLVFQRIDTDGKTPVYTFPYSDGVNKIPFSRAYRPSSSLGSRYQIQLGVRYLFN